MNHFTVFSPQLQGEHESLPTKSNSKSRNPSFPESTVEPDLGLNEPPSCPFDPDKQHLIDLAEHNVNDCSVGKRSQISIKRELITSISRLMIDVDPGEWKGVLSDRELADPSLINPKLFWKHHLELMLDRHPLLSKAEVRFSGRGFHVLVCLEEPVVFTDDAARDLWQHRLQILQCLIPSDPRAPGLNIMTRPLNSINSKNGRRVVLVRKPTLVSAQEVIEAVDQFRAAPFQTIAQTLFGRSSSPCPLCETPGSSLRIRTHNGICYGGKCGGRVYPSDLFDRFMVGPWSPLQTGGGQ